MPELLYNFYIKYLTGNHASRKSVILMDTKENSMEKFVSLLLNHPRKVSLMTPSDQDYKGLEFISFPHKLQLRSCIVWPLQVNRINHFRKSSWKFNFTKQLRTSCESVCILFCGEWKQSVKISLCKSIRTRIICNFCMIQLCCRDQESVLIHSRKTNPCHKKKGVPYPAIQFSGGH